MVYLLFPSYVLLPYLVEPAPSPHNCCEKTVCFCFLSDLFSFLFLFASAATMQCVSTETSTLTTLHLREFYLRTTSTVSSTTTGTTTI